MADQLAMIPGGGSAVISECGRYRYELRRVWDPTGPLLEFVMLNPSTADASVDDPTIRRCVAFAKAWGYGGIVVRNLYALRATNPEALLNYSGGDAYGPRNDEFIGSNIADCTIAAWGAHAATLAPNAVAAIKVLQMCRPRLYCLGTNANGSPKHPLYVPSSRTPIQWEMPNA